MKNLTWNEYKATCKDKEAFRLTHYSSLFNSAHCKAVINDRNFILGWDDRYTNTLEWNNQVNQISDRHLGQFVEITPVVAEEIKQRLRDYQESLEKVTAHLKTGLAGYEYNSAVNAVEHAKKMVKIYTDIVELLPVFSVDVAGDIKAIVKENEDKLTSETDFYKIRIIKDAIEFYNRILLNLPVLEATPFESATLQQHKEHMQVFIDRREELKQLIGDSALMQYLSLTSSWGINMDGILIVLSDFNTLDSKELQTAVNEYVKHKSGNCDFIKTGSLFITSLKTFIKKMNDGTLPATITMTAHAIQYETVIEHRITDQT